MKKLFLSVFLAGFLFTAIGQPAKNFTLLDSVNYSPQTLSGCWHYNTDSSEYALIGGSQGIIIADITDPFNIQTLFQLPGVPSIWHEVKVVGDFAYAVCQNSDPDTVTKMNGVQIIDLRSLPDSAPYTFYYGDSIIANQLVTVHSITAAGHYIYLNGHNIGSLGAGVIILDVSDPMFPKYTGAITQRYCHDSYVRGDRIYTSDGNNALVTIYDISNPSNPIELATQSTEGYNHNSWLSDDGNTLFTVDETHNTALQAYDISNLGNISQIDTFYNKYFSDFEVHNVRVINDFLINPSYGSQITLVDADRPNNLIEVGNYTTGTALCWDADPFTNSGNIITTDEYTGNFYLFSANYQRACYLEGLVTDSLTGLPINNALVEILAVPATVTSNVIGEYRTGYADSGSYVVRFSKNNYVTRQINVNLQNGVLTTMNVKLLTTSAGINSITSEEIKIYPNPAGSVLNVKSASFNISAWTITDASGKMVQRESDENQVSNELEIDVHRLAKGTYFLEMQNGSERIVRAFEKN